MPDWSKEVVLALIAAATGGVAWWFKTRHDDKVRREAAQQTIIDRLQKRHDDLQARFESLLMDAKMKAEDDRAERAESIATNKQLAAVTTAMIAALDRANAINARLTRDGT